MSREFDLAILGSGFGGSLLAMVARRLGLRVLLLERGAHPRFAIGESTSPLANLLLEELAEKYDLPRLLPFATYGTWKRTYPEVTVGLKRGFTFYQHRAGTRFDPDPEHSRELLVAASPSDEVADTHWYRADFDAFLVREAQSLGVDYVDRVAIDRMDREGEALTLQGSRGGQSVVYRARFVVDATGARGALSRLLNLPEDSFPGLPPTRALFTHFADVERFATVAVPDGETPPYPPDDAALHHVFDGGWMWVLRFDNGITSAGIAVEDRLAEELRLEEGAVAWQRFLEHYPSIRDQFQTARPVLPFLHAPRLPYRCRQLTGPGWVMLPSAAAFIDPLFSTGFPLTLLGIHRLGQALQESWGTEAFEPRLREYAEATSREAEAAALLVGGCYASFADFSAFAALSMLYFVAASYSEMARRLGRADLASEFLLLNRPAFRRAFLLALRAAPGGLRIADCGLRIEGTGPPGEPEGSSVRGWPFVPSIRNPQSAIRNPPGARSRPKGEEPLATALEPFNIAGLCDPAKRNWYHVDLNDVVRGAGKLKRSPEEVRAFFARMGWR